MPQIQASVQSFSELFASHKLLRVPLYQRPYSWDREQWDQLVRDIEELEGDEPHFLGSVVLAPETAPGTPARKEVVDGQQRLATLSVLAAVLRNHFARIGETALADQIHFSCLMKASFDSEPLPRLVLGEKERDWFDKLVRSYHAGEEDVADPKPPRRSDPRGVKLLMKCYRFFEALMDSEERALKPKQLAAILTERLLFVVTTTQAEEDAYTLFECLNDRGLSLSVADLFKNHLLSRLRTRSCEEFEDSLQEWSMMESILDRDLGNYLRHFWLSTREKVTQRQLYRALKRESLAGHLDPRTFIMGLYDQMEDYRHITHPAPVLEQRTAAHQREMWLLSELRTLQFRVVYSLLLAAWKVFRHDHAGRIRVLEMADAFLVCWATFAGRVTNRLEPLFSRLARELRASTEDDAAKLASLQQALATESPPLEAIRSGFLDLEPSPKVAAALLTRIAYETHGEQREPGEVVAVPLVDASELRNGSRVSGLLDADAFREVAGRLGNFVLLPKGGEKGFRDLRTVADRLRFAAACESPSAVNPPPDREAWDAETVRQRQQLLWEQVRRIWVPGAEEQARLADAASGTMRPLEA